MQAGSRQARQHSGSGQPDRCPLNQSRETSVTAPRSIGADDPLLPDVLALIRRSFAYMEGRIDPPSSVHRLTLITMQDHCRKGGEIWVTGTAPAACMFLTPRADCLYLGKLAVDQNHRGTGLARQMVAAAASRARDFGLPALELQTRVELVENHRAFAKLGFVKTAEGSHPGYTRVTDITMRMAV